MKNTSEKGMVPDVDYSNNQQPNHPYTSHREYRPDLSLTVIACEVKDWNLELSPWKGVSIDGRILGGGGSGSFWVDGWSDYAKTHALRKKASIYLSLGGKEDKTDNPLMATVGTRTKELERKMFRTVCEKKQECKERCERSVTFHVIRQ
ncbi:MAG: hypothetical protein MJ063_00815 [Lachnospiraceae bacterium]|nr:hypothetical protein [Lachnospiraceae bacterium]